MTQADSTTQQLEQASRALHGASTTPRDHMGLIHPLFGKVRSQDFVAPDVGGQLKVSLCNRRVSRDAAGRAQCHAQRAGREGRQCGHPAGTVKLSVIDLSDEETSASSSDAEDQTFVGQTNASSTKSSAEQVPAAANPPPPQAPPPRSCSSMEFAASQP